MAHGSPPAVASPSTSGPVPPPVSGDTGGGVLSPIDRLTELLYGIVLVLTFTGALRVAAQGGDDVVSTLWAAVGCSLAWGLVDASMYVFSSLASRNRSYYLVRKLRHDPGGARRDLMAAVPAAVAGALNAEEWDRIVATLARVPVPERARVRRDDVTGAIGIFLLANAALLPLVVPFAVLSDIDLAQNVSNAVALVMLFACGYSMARFSGSPPVVTALQLTLYGVVLIAATIALGG